MKSDLSNRQRNILFAIVKEFCDIGTSPGSKELAEKYGFDFSPATIRNEIAVLRKRGYLIQPFTNSASQPTEKSFKMFITKLIEGLQVSSTQQSKLRSQIINLQKQHVEMSKEIAKLLADQVGGVGFTLTSHGENIKGIGNLLNHPNEGKISDILTFLDHLDEYKGHLLPGEVVENIIDSDKDLKANKSTIKMIIGNENPVIPLGKGYAMVSTEVILENGEKSVVGLITPIQLLAKKKNLQLLQAINKIFTANAKD